MVPPTRPEITADCLARMTSVSVSGLEPRTLMRPDEIASRITPFSMQTRTPLRSKTRGAEAPSASLVLAAAKATQIAAAWRTDGLREIGWAVLASGLNG